MNFHLSRKLMTTTQDQQIACQHLPSTLGAMVMAFPTWKPEKVTPAEEASVSTSKVNCHVKKTEFTHDSITWAAAGGTLPSSSVKHDFSFRSNDCSKLTLLVFTPKFCCTHTKSEAIAVDLLAEESPTVKGCQFYIKVMRCYKQKIRKFQ